MDENLLEREKKWNELNDQAFLITSTSFTPDEGGALREVFKLVKSELMTEDELPPNLRALWERAQRLGLLDLTDQIRSLIRTPDEQDMFMARRGIAYRNTN
jgi:hypothetical protein